MRQARRNSLVTGNDDTTTRGRRLSALAARPVVSHRDKLIRKERRKSSIASGALKTEQIWLNIFGSSVNIYEYVSVERGKRKQRGQGSIARRRCAVLFVCARTGC
jgi:hypothetical protein